MSDVQPIQSAERENLFLRNDTIFGVCEALGQDFGFNANWLRVALCASLYFSPMGVIGGYLAVGLLVAASRLLFPAPQVEAPAASVNPAVEEVSAPEEQRELPLAA